MGPITVREADLHDAQDAARIVALTEMYSHEELVDRVGLTDEVKATLVQAMRDHGGIRVWLAFRGPDAVGICTTVKSFTAFGARPILNIHDLAVTPEARGQGVGKALMDAAEAWAQAQGYGKMSLEVHPKNDAKRLYARQGYAFASEYWTKKL